MSIRQRMTLVLAILLIIPVGILGCWTYNMDHPISVETAMLWLLIGFVVALLLVVFKEYPFTGLNALEDTKTSMSFTLGKMLVEAKDEEMAFVFDHVISEARKFPELYYDVVASLPRKRFGQFLEYCTAKRKNEWENGKTKITDLSGGKVVELGYEMRQLDRLIDMLINGKSAEDGVPAATPTHA